ncbi:MAG: hypothetical protein ACHQJ5_02325 [Vicinamibacteria bacterium]
MRGRLALYAGLIAAATVVQLLRVWQLDPLRHIYFEDGFRWLADAENADLGTALTSTYNGYLQTSSRLVAEVVAMLPVGWWAAAMAVSGAAIVSACAFVVWRTSAAQIRDRYLRAGLAALVILCGAFGPEALGNVVDTIWFITFACLWLLLWRPGSERAAGLAGAALILGGLSHTAMIFLAPVWLLRAIAVRDRRDLLIVGGYALGVLVQFVVSHQDLSQNQAGLDYIGGNHWDWNLVLGYAQRAVGETLLGHTIDAELWGWIGWPFAALLLALFAGLVIRGLQLARTRLIVPLLSVTSLALFLTTGYLRWPVGGSDLFWGAEADTVADRYVVIPALLLLTAIVIQLDAELARASPRRAGVLAGALASALACVLISFPIEPVTSGLAPTWGADLDQARAQCDATGVETVNVVPLPDTFALLVIPVDCERLR